ncbi:MAG: RdgB/HAM1 family non-canonical purine NTP pyrophosphatase [Anaerolineae bacterium]|nr:RdgB/HAM1 family non-canonical purine NTP pyrophosphatase [Anaerolineae bacterium]
MSQVKKLLVATHNKGKISEFAEMMQDMAVDWLGLADVGVVEDVPETGHTFRDNAVLKATAYAQMAGCLTLADDSGLEVDALHGAPGVYSARYGGAGLSSEGRIALVLQQLALVPEVARKARFRCVIVVADANGRILAEADGVCEGLITSAPVGSGGFGYDPIFRVSELGKTMAQLSSAEKHQMSHRGRAMRKLEPFLRQILT